MFFSIVMPVYKTETELLKRAISSVLSQDYTDWELIVVDDNPKGTEWKDAIKTICGQYIDDRIVLQIHGDNKGANVARNTGVSSSRGKYIAFLDADDEWDSDYLSSVFQLIREKNPDIAASGYRLITTDRIYDMIGQSETDGNIYMEMIYRDLVGPTSAVVVKKSSLLQIGGFDETLPARQDYDTWLRICKNGGTVAYIRKAKLSIYRTDRESISTRGMNHIDGTEMVLSKLLSDPDLKEFYSKIKTSHFLESARSAMSLERYDIARKYIKKAARENVSMKIVFYYIATLCPSGFKRAKKLYWNIKYKRQIDN